MVIATSETLKTPPLPAEFEALFRDHYEFVHRTAYRVTGNFADAEDVIQTLFMRLCRRDLPAEISANPRGYLYRAAVNIALDVIRTKRRHPAEHNEQEMLKARAAGPTSPGEEELFERLRHSLSELNPKLAEMLILRHVHGYTDFEIAKLLGASRTSVAVNLFRARARLRKALETHERP